MDFADQLRVLQVAQGDPAKLALVTVDLAFPELPDVERAALKAALEAAAIPHWCDATILAGLLEIPEPESAALLLRLGGLSVVEPFPARGSDAVNVHEASRLALRKMLAADLPRFRAVSARATACFADDLTPAGRIEWIYHLLCSDSENAASELERLDRSWSSAAPPEDRYALAVALHELQNSELVQGRARLWSLIVTTWTRASRGEEAQLAGIANTILDLARSVADPTAEGDALHILGDALRAQGKLGEASAAFGKALAIRQRLAEQDPNNAGWQRELAVAHTRAGEVFKAQGELAEAQVALESALAISRRLAEQEPAIAGRQRDLALAHIFVGGVYKAQGKLPEARTAFVSALAINQALVNQDLGNIRWLRELAVAHTHLGGVFEAQGELPEAQAAFESALAIQLSLAERDKHNFRWQRDLAATQNLLGGAFESQGRLPEAQAAFELALAIIQRLTEQDTDNLRWQRDLAISHNRLGRIFKAQDKLSQAKSAFEAERAIRQRLAASQEATKSDPSLM